MKTFTLYEKIEIINNAIKIKEKHNKFKIGLYYKYFSLLNDSIKKHKTNKNKLDMLYRLKNDLLNLINEIESDIKILEQKGNI